MIKQAKDNYVEELIKNNNKLQNVIEGNDNVEFVAKIGNIAEGIFNLYLIHNFFNL